MKRQIFAALISGLVMTGSLAEQKTDVFKTKNGKEVKITCIKHASIEINYDGVEIEVDPVSSVIPPTTDYSQFPKANIILITHEHHDHFDREAIHCLRTPATVIYTNQAVYNMFHDCKPLSNGDSIAYREDIKIEAVPAYNTTEGHQQFHPKGRDNGYVLTLDGLRIYIAGDTEDIPEMAALKDIDIAFLPCNQPYTMTPEQLATAAKSFMPRVLFPYHYSETRINKVSFLLSGNGIDVRIRAYK